jgi:hypothetical protein
MPKISLPVGPRLWTRIVRRAAELGLSPTAYLRKLIWRDVTKGEEEKARAKLQRKR